MSRVVKNAEEHFAITLREYGQELIFLAGGRSSYLWVGPDDERQATIYTFSGPAALRALAKAILAEIPSPKPRKRGPRP